MTGSRQKLWSLALSAFLFLSVAAGVTVLSGTAAADTPDCSGVSYSGSGTSGDPYQVGTVDQLQCIENQGLDTQYELTGDIDASGTSSWNSGNGFDPIGDSNSEFTGTFDGNGHAISGLTIDRGGTNDVGLFGKVDPGGTVRTVRLDGGTVTGSESVGALIGSGNGTVSQSVATVDVTASGEYVGGLVGYSGGTVQTSTATGAVTSTDGGRVGGLVGENEGTVESSNATGDVTSESPNSGRVGGLVGLGRGTVEDSYATGDVATDVLYAGGLVGESYGTIEDSYATGDVTADTSAAGGLAGSSSSATIRRTYATGAVSITDGDTGGLVGDVDEGVGGSTIANSYWDAGTTDQGNAFGTTFGEVTTSGLTSFGSTDDSAPASEMQGSSAATNMDELDFTSTWETVESGDEDAAADGYPILSALDRTAQLRAQGKTSATAPTTTVCDGLSWTTRQVSGETYYEVDRLYKLQCIEQQGLGNNYVLTDDIDASETADWNGNAGFEPLGDTGTEFTGTFDGDGHTISGLTIDRSSELQLGAFGVAFDATITRVHLTDVSVTGQENVGGLVGQSSGGTTVSEASVSGAVGIGANVDTVGGLVGFNNGSTVSHSYATATVSTSDGQVGGLVGNNTGSVSESYATGSVSGSYNVGGLAGVNFGAGELENAYWDNGTTNQGSAIGRNYEASTGGTGFGATTDTDPAPEMQGSSATANMDGLDFTSTWETVESGDADAAADGYPILGALDRKAQLEAQGIYTLGVSSITRSSPSSEKTNADSAEFEVAFPEPVENVGTDDFATSGSASGTVDSVSSASGSTITVTVASVSGDGSLGLDLASGGDITDSNGNSIATTEPGTDETYTIDNTAPSVSDVTLTDATDGDGVVAAGDSIQVTATATDTDTISMVDADASAFDAGMVTLDDDGPNSAAADDQYSATVTVGAAPTEGEQSVTASATDAAGNGGSQAVESDAVTVESSGGSSIQERTRQQDDRAPTADAGENRTVEPGALVVLDGSNSTDDMSIARYRWDYTSDGTVEGNLPRKQTAFDRPGTYTATLTVEDEAGKTDSDTVTITVRNASAGNRTGNQSTARVSVSSTQNGTAGWSATVSNASADQPVDITVRDTEDGTAADGQSVAVSRLQMNVNRESNFTLDVTTSDTPPDSDTDDDESEGRNFEQDTGTRAVGYMSIDHTVPDEHIDDVTFTVEVRNSRLDQPGATPDSVALYRDETDRWNRLPTTVVGETDTHYTVEATSPGLSVFSIGAGAAAVEVTGAQVSPDTLESGESAAVTATVTNRGTASETRIVNLTANGSVLGSESVEVAAGSNRTVTLEPTFETPGTYALAVGGQSAGTVTVQATQTTPTPASTATGPLTDATATATDADQQATESTTTTGSGPGFGPGVTLAAAVLAIVGKLGRRRRNRR